MVEFNRASQPNTIKVKHNSHNALAARKFTTDSFQTEVDEDEDDMFEKIMRQDAGLQQLSRSQINSSVLQNNGASKMKPAFHHGVTLPVGSTSKQHHLIKRLKKYIKDITSVPNIDKKQFGSQSVLEESKDANLGREEAKGGRSDQNLEESKVDHAASKDEKLKKITETIKLYPEALFNLQFFNPYIKSRSEYSYSDLMDEFKHMECSLKDKFCRDLKDYIKDLKREILELNKDELASKLLPLMHISMFMITYFLCKEHGRENNSSSFRDFEKRQAILKDLADEAHEFRLLPVPYGLLTHELIEVVDSERIMPGLSLISKLAEDFPWIDYHSRNKEGQKENLKHKHQDVFVFGGLKSASMARIIQVMERKKHSKLIKQFKEYNDLRYTFIRNLFQQYDMLHDIPAGHEITFEHHLKLLQSSYIWNVYKHLT